MNVVNVVDFYSIFIIKLDYLNFSKTHHLCFSLLFNSTTQTGGLTAMIFLFVHRSEHDMMYRNGCRKLSNPDFWFWPGHIACCGPIAWLHMYLQAAVLSCCKC